MILLHGDNQPASRDQLLQLTKQAQTKNQEIIKLGGEKLTLESIIQAREPQSFFATEKLIIVENFFSRPKSREKEAIIHYLAGTFDWKESTSPQIIFWERKEIGKTAFKKLDPFLDKRLFKIPVLLFKFLDGFYPQNKKTLLTLLGVLTQEKTEITFWLLTRRISQLIIAQSLGQKGLTDLAAWQQYKILAQAKKFSLEQLRAIYRRLLAIDINLKTGQNLVDLKGQLDLLVVTL